MPYAWGSRSAIASLRGHDVPAPEPQAELWMGAHPLAPSKLAQAHGGRSLVHLIEEAPEHHLGERVLSRFGARLPFLMKVLAAEEPLSLQAHPSLDRAKAGFEREERAGIPLSASHRVYKDPNHKPELLCALEPFEALSGFREHPEALEVLTALGVPHLEPILTLLRSSSTPLKDTFEALMRLADEHRAPLVEAVGAAARERAKDGGPHARAYHWAATLAHRYPGDAGVVSSLLLRHVELAVGEAIFLPAGNLHAYLRGVGIEIMASSDNVLRGGLTTKHVDVEELLAVLDFDAVGPELVKPEVVRAGVHAYRTSAPDFELSRIEVTDGAIVAEVESAEIVFCAKGEVVLSGATSVTLRSGESAFVPASVAAYRAEGSGTLFRATPGRS